MVQLELDEFYLESRFIFKPEIIILDSVMGMNYGLKQGHIIFPRQFSDDAVVGHAFLEGYIDVGDGCWKRKLRFKLCVGESFKMAPISTVFLQ